MKTVTIIFSDQRHTKSVYENVLRAEVHTYGFLELVFPDKVCEYVSLASIFSFKVTG